MTLQTENLDRPAAGGDSTERKARVSIGIPVRNGEATLPKTLDSLLGQTYSEFEIVISDNASEDRTQAICLAYAAKDSRIRYFRNETDLGQIANFNRVFELSHGEYFRWVGCNDWWAPEYVARCVASLDARPEAVLATCYQQHLDGDGGSHYQEYTGRRADSDDVANRLLRTLWFFRRSRYYIDPIYSLMRRSALEQTSLFPAMMGTDLVLSAELSLIGPFEHVPQCLAFRRITPEVRREVLVARFDPQMPRPRWRTAQITRAIARRMLARPMSGTQRIVCLLGLGNYLLRRSLFYAYRRVRRWLGGVTGYRVAKAYIQRKRVRDAARAPESVG